VNKKADILKTLMTSATAKVSAFGWGVLIVSLINQDVILKLITKLIDSTEYSEVIYIALSTLIALLTQWGVVEKRRDGDDKPLIKDR
jgi:hypothetical protein